MSATERPGRFAADVETLTDTELVRVRSVEFQRTIDRHLEHRDPRHDELNGGHIRALSLGVKPAIQLNGISSFGSQAHTLAAELRRIGVDAYADGNVLIDRTLVDKRAESEPVLAAEVGWSRSLPVDAQWTRALSSDGASPDKQIVGFVLGIPGSAIRGFENERKILARTGALIPEKLFRALRGQAAENGTATNRLVVDLLPKDREMVSVIAEESERTDRALKSMTFAEEAARRPVEQDRFFTVYGTQLERIYTSYTDMSRSEARHLLSRRTRYICAPDGSVTHVFITYGPDGFRAPDVLRLERRVRAAFQQLENGST